jgi:hypothetical protein
MIKIEFNGSGEEVRNEMLRLLGLQEPKDPMEVIKEEVTGKTAQQQDKVKTKRQRKGRKAQGASTPIWSEKEAENLLNQIKRNARRIIAELANKPEGYRISELAQSLGLQESAIRGQLSSVGFALKRMDRKPSPIQRVKIDGELTYKLDSVVAGVAKQ